MCAGGKRIVQRDMWERCMWEWRFEMLRMMDLSIGICNMLWLWGCCML